MYCSDSCRQADWEEKHPRLNFGPPEERSRLSHQCEAILERLKRGRATNGELARIALKYTNRVSDIRQKGYDVRVVEHDRKTGVAWYALFVEGKELQP